MQQEWLSYFLDEEIDRVRFPFLKKAQETYIVAARARSDQRWNSAATRKSASFDFDEPVLRADHPFLFIIRHRPSGAVLFVGRVDDPTAASR